MVFSQHASFSCSFKQYVIVIVQQYKQINNSKNKRENSLQWYI